MTDPTLPPLPDQWQLDSGLRDEIKRFTIASAYFSFTQSYMDGKAIRLYLIGFDEEGETATIKMTVGSDWDTPDAGRTISHATKNHINMNSIYGHWIRNAVAIPELYKVLMERDTGIGPRRAEIWTDMVIHCEAKPFQMGKPSPDNPPRNYLMPTEFFGMDSGSGMNSSPGPSQDTTASAKLEPATPTTAPTAADRVAAARAAKASVDVTNVTNPLLTRVRELAASSSSYAEFQSKAFDIDEVLADDVVAELVADEQNGIYAQVKKGQ